MPSSRSSSSSYSRFEADQEPPAKKHKRDEKGRCDSDIHSAAAPPISVPSQKNDCIVITDSPEITRNREHRIILTYPKGSGGYAISTYDYKTLGGENYLNDVIINFYLSYIHNELLNHDLRSKVSLFSTNFYTQLNDGKSKRKHDNVAKWTKNQNIFEKEYIIIPINDKEMKHWYLAIICFPSDPEPSSSKRDPCILLFDSLGGAWRTEVFDVLRDYLTEEYKAKNPHAERKIFNKENMVGQVMNVPQQPNLFDCGLFLLQNVEHFFKEPLQDFCFPIKSLRNWYSPEIVSRKREEISNVIKQLMIAQLMSELPVLVFSPPIPSASSDQAIEVGIQTPTIKTDLSYSKLINIHVHVESLSDLSESNEFIKLVLDLLDLPFEEGNERIAHFIMAKKLFSVFDKKEGEVSCLTVFDRIFSLIELPLSVQLECERCHGRMPLKVLRMTYQEAVNLKCLAASFTQAVNGSEICKCEEEGHIKRNFNKVVHAELTCLTSEDPQCKVEDIGAEIAFGDFILKRSVLIVRERAHFYVLGLTGNGQLFEYNDVPGFKHESEMITPEHMILFKSEVRSQKHVRFAIETAQRALAKERVSKVAVDKKESPPEVVTMPRMETRLQEAKEGPHQQPNAILRILKHKTQQKAKNVAPEAHSERDTSVTLVESSFVEDMDVDEESPHRQPNTVLRILTQRILRKAKEVAPESSESVVVSECGASVTLVSSSEDVSEINVTINEELPVSSSSESSNFP